MNKDNAREYLPLVQALAEGKTIQELYYPEKGEESWVCVGNDCSFFRPPHCYRIKPEPVKGWYRVALLGVGVGQYTYTVEDEESEEYVGGGIDFVRWLTDRIEYEVEA